MSDVPSDPAAGRPLGAEFARTLLFVPGSRPERFAKAAGSGADLVVVDLEDAVGAEAKATARRCVREYLDAGALAAVRINGVRTEWHSTDVEEVASRASAVMLPKAEAGFELIQLGARLLPLGIPLIALLETAAGILDARAIAATPGVQRLAFGSLDFAAEVNVDPLDRDALALARSFLVLASAANGLVGPIDGVRTSLDDEAGLRDETAWAHRLGFAGKLCIHPRQVAIVRDVLAVGPDEVAWASKVISAVAASGDAVVTVDGAMVDKPVIDRARRIMQG